MFQTSTTIEIDNVRQPHHRDEVRKLPMSNVEEPARAVDKHRTSREGFPHIHTMLKQIFNGIYASRAYSITLNSPKVMHAEYVSLVGASNCIVTLWSAEQSRLDMGKIY